MRKPTLGVEWKYGLVETQEGLFQQISLGVLLSGRLQNYLNWNTKPRLNQQMTDETLPATFELYSPEEKSK